MRWPLISFFQCIYRITITLNVFVGRFANETQDCIIALVATLPVKVIFSYTSLFNFSRNNISASNICLKI